MREISTEADPLALVDAFAETTARADEEILRQSDHLKNLGPLVPDPSWAERVAKMPRCLAIFCLVARQMFRSEKAYRPSEIPTLGALPCPLCSGEHQLISVQTAMRERFHVRPAFAGVLMDGPGLSADDLLPKHENISRQFPGTVRSITRNKARHPATRRRRKRR